MAINLPGLGKKIWETLGQGVDRVVPGDQSYLYKQPPSQAIRRAANSEIGRAAQRGPVGLLNLGVSKAAQLDKQLIGGFEQNAPEPIKPAVSFINRNFLDPQLTVPQRLGQAGAGQNPYSSGKRGLGEAGSDVVNALAWGPLAVAKTGSLGIRAAKGFAAGAPLGIASSATADMAADKPISITNAGITGAATGALNTIPVVGPAAVGKIKSMLPPKAVQDAAKVSVVTNSPTPAKPLLPEAKPISYIDAQQALEKQAGNRTIDEIIGGKVVPRVSTKAHGIQDTVASAVTNTAGKLTGKALESQNPVVHMIGELAHGVSRKSTMTNYQKTLLEQVKGRSGGLGQGLRDQLQTKLDEPLAGLDEATKAASKEKVYRVFELHTDGNKAASKKLLGQLNDVEKAYFEGIKKANILRNEFNRGQMSDEVIAKGETGMHMPRLFDDSVFNKEFDPESYALYTGRTLDLNPTKRRAQLDDLSKELQDMVSTDPTKANIIRTEIALHNKGIIEFGDELMKMPGIVSDVKLKGYIPMPESPRYGQLAGKYVRKDLGESLVYGSDKYETVAGKAVNDLLNRWQTSALGKIESALRQGLTVFNPATRLGNRTANITQGAMAGFNAPEMAARQQTHLKALTGGGSEMTRLARAYGVIDNDQGLAKLSGVGHELGTDNVGKLAGTKNWLGARQKSYQATDDGARVALFEWQLKKGASPEEAARFANRALPNAANSGEIYSFFSRLPVLGTAFRAIQPEIYRALASSATRRTAPFLTAMAMYTTFQNWTWEDIPEEERKQVQERFGAGQTPFAKLNATNDLTGKVLPSSWSFNASKFTGSEDIYDIDPRRLAGVYSINTSTDLGSGALDEVKKVAPTKIPLKYEDGKLSFQPQDVVGSNTFGPIAQAVIDRDFRGKSIQDPEGKIYTDKGVQNKFVKEDGTPDIKKDPARLAEFLARSYVPQIGDVKNVADASQGKPNFYGQEMTTTQAGLRFVGLKGEKFDAARLKDMKETNRYFDEKEQIDKMVEGLPKDSQERFKRLTGYYKFREKVPNEFEPGSERYKKASVFNFTEEKWREYTSDPKLYDLMVEKKRREAQPNDKGIAKPIQPEFDERLSKEFRMQLINNKSLAPGEDIEADQRMYSNPEYDKYIAIKDEYSAQAKKYYPQNGDDFVDELVKHKEAPFPTKGAAKVAYDNAYALYTEGKGPKPVFTDQVKAEKESYELAKLAWTNNERKARGLAAIPAEMWMNSSFGYNENEDTYKKYAKGSGGGSGGSSAASNPYKYAVSINAGGKVKSNKVSVKMPSGKIAKAKRVPGPKVKTKKSMV